MPRRDPGVRDSVFLNIPYDSAFERLYFAYIAGVSAFGLVPRATLEIPGSTRRLERILELIESCAYSIHDLSRVQLDRNPPATPRFNMPFELGLTVAWQRVASRKHVWFVCESVPHRALKSLSDINGTEIYVHGGTVAGVFRELCNAFVRERLQPSVQQMNDIYGYLRRNAPEILRRAGTASVFGARVFRELSLAGSRAADRAVLQRRRA